MVEPELTLTTQIDCILVQNLIYLTIRIRNISISARNMIALIEM